MIRICAVLLLILAGCVRAGSPNVSVVLNHGNCQHIDQGATVVDYADLARIRGAELIGMTQPSDPGSGEPTLIAISLGTRPTLGYEVRLIGAPELAGDRLMMSVTAEGPPPDAMVAQMLANPCLVVAVDEPAVRHVRVEDASGAPVGELTLGPRAD